jgi:hypothetical protein
MVADNENVIEKNVQETVVQSYENQNQSPEVSQEKKDFSDKEINFSKLREAKEQLERENRELRQYNQRHAIYKESQPKEDDELGIDDDDIVEGKVIKRLYNELKTLKNFKSVYEQKEMASIPSRLQSKFSDFDQVVTQENIDKLKHAEPELYASITSGSDLYAKGVSAYKTLKALGIVKDDPYVSQKEKVQANQSRPLSTQAIKGQGVLSDANVFANGLTPDLKKQLQQEMEQAVKAR